jgi:hypothetical protein
MYPTPNKPTPSQIAIFVIAAQLDIFPCRFGGALLPLTKRALSTKYGVDTPNISPRMSANSLQKRVFSSHLAQMRSASQEHNSTIRQREEFNSLSTLFVLQTVSQAAQSFDTISLSAGVAEDRVKVSQPCLSR